MNNSTLHELAKRGNAKKVEEGIKKGSLSPHSVNADWETALHVAWYVRVITKLSGSVRTER